MNSYDDVFESHVTIRNPQIGVEDVLDWARSLAPGSTILDLGCGHGVPISAALVNAGFQVFGLDVSARMIAAFRSNLPTAIAECAAIQESDFFGRTFDGIVAWGVMFLLSAAEQEAVIAKVAQALKPGALFLFTAPKAVAAWEDTLAGVTFPSVSLGAGRYERLLREHGLMLVGRHFDEWDNHYYSVVKATEG